MVEFRMPSLGADMESGFLREWRVKTGDPIKRGDIIAEVETQKGIIDIEVFDEGIVGELLIKVDDKVPVGTLMTYILSPEEAAVGVKSSPVTEEKEKVITKVESPKEKAVIVPEAHHIRASPLARKIAEEKGIDISNVKGTGPDGAITRLDVELALQSGTPVSSEKTVTENIRMAVAAAMSKSNREVPHYYLQTKVDMSRALAWLADANKQRPVKDRLLPVVLLVKAVAKALADVPDLNAWWENGLHRKQEIHIGFVVSLRNGGIIVPAIHDVDKKSLDELMRSLSDIIPRARALKLRSSELADSTITVTSLGENAVETVYGIIYPPQVALIGFGGITQEPWAENGMLAARPVLTVTLSADHRATDGNTGSTFLTALKNHLKNPEQL
jgi:pyruvate dehydrogenase E2 component (dihydrolipoamide acetyltransferase)